MAVNANYDALLTTTLANYRDTLEDNISREVGLWSYLSRKDRIKTKDGGHKIVIPLLYGKNSTSASYSMYETLDTDPQDGISAAEYPWKSHAVSISIAGLEEAMNSGENEVIDLLEAKIQQAEMSAADDFATMFASDGTGNSAKDFLGVAALVGDEASDVTVVGGIDATTAGNEFWRSHVNRTVEVLSLARMGTAFNAASRGSNQPDGVFSGGTLYEKHVSLLQPIQRISDPKTGEAGFRNILFMGAPHVADAALETLEVGSVYFLNSKFLGITKLKDVWLKNGPFQKPTNVDARIAQITSYANMWISNRKLGGAKLEGKTAV
jgi:hypothetical protein